MRLARIVDRLASPEAARMFGDAAPVLADHDPRKHASRQYGDLWLPKISSYLAQLHEWSTLAPG